ncbi:conserved hypothetical protein [Candida dubliniensis CD36]|uniref:Transmembrane protein n=1 Tax=Candida dubliniensis (strain CD36 / ATCC MYA-646 / CBS 7987 / NCPF 3949 / NRRL Y-17841) TaxID=573826 RepID=B9W734_CANDC|nr:conserved hypothetical protein [Candida dubliniensis CD36]CAX44492.1 conserved hypothetical protein [Candida dubliniensis CD36]
MDQDNEIDRLHETELWNNNNNSNNDHNDLTLPSSITAFDPIQQQELEQLQALLDPTSTSLQNHNEQEGEEQELKNNDTSQCWIRTLIFIGYCISTVFFSIHLWIQYFFIKYTYDDQTAVNMLNYVTAAQEQAIDEYSRKTKRRTSSNSSMRRRMRRRSSRESDLHP